jgi:hypothetical protein
MTTPEPGPAPKVCAPGAYCGECMACSMYGTTRDIYREREDWRTMRQMISDLGPPIPDDDEDDDR